MLVTLVVILMAMIMIQRDGYPIYGYTVNAKATIDTDKFTKLNTM